MTAEPYTYILFEYNPYTNKQTVMGRGFIEDHMIEHMETLDQTMYYSLYRYDETTTYMDKKADVFLLWRKMTGIHNRGVFPFQPPCKAIKFENELKWFYLYGE